MFWARYLSLVALMTAGCASQRQWSHQGGGHTADFEPPSSSPLKAFSIQSGTHLQWTQVTAGRARAEVIARAVNERVHVVVGLTSAGLEVGVTPLQSGAEQAWIGPAPVFSDALRHDGSPLSQRLGAITIAGNSASVAASDGRTFVYGKLGLLDQTWFEASVLPPNGARLMWIGRGDDGWIVIGGRSDRVGVHDWRDYVSWFVEDTATQWPQPYVLAERDQHQYGSVKADASAAGVFAMALLPEGFSAYVGKNGRWSAIEKAPFPFRAARTVLTPLLSGWLLEATAEMFPPNPKYPTMAVWIDAESHKARLLENYPSAPTLPVWVIADGKPLMSTRHGSKSHSAAANSALVRGSFVHDITRDTTREVQAATTPALRGATWHPALRIDLGDRVCMVGGALWHKEWGARYLHAAACLDLDSLNWRWLALQLGATENKWIGSDRVSGGRQQPVCNRLGMLDEAAIVECRQRTIITMPANWEWPSRQVDGGEEWTLQLVRWVEGRNG